MRIGQYSIKDLGYHYDCTLYWSFTVTQFKETVYLRFLTGISVKYFTILHVCFASYVAAVKVQPKTPTHRLCTRISMAKFCTAYHISHITYPGGGRNMHSGIRYYEQDHCAFYYHNESFNRSSKLPIALSMQAFEMIDRQVIFNSRCPPPILQTMITR